MRGIRDEPPPPIFLSLCLVSVKIKALDVYKLHGVGSRGGATSRASEASRA